MNPEPASTARRSQSFRRDQRLLTAKDYKRVFARAERSVDRYWTVLARPQAGNKPRLGLAIAKKVVRDASARNRLKRLVRESFRHRATEMLSLDFVVLVRRDAMRATNAALYGSLDKHWRRLCAPPKSGSKDL